jgi:hypothetical protein
VLKVQIDALNIDSDDIGIDNIIVSESSTGQIAGDYNGNGVVDAADYVVWRKNNSTNNTLPNDNGLGTPIGQSHYNLWRAHFGQPPGSGAGAITSAAVPEPATVALLIVGILAMSSGRRVDVS